jgi:multidrug efflux pump subunit AcrA (membrane-fusion protein)
MELNNPTKSKRPTKVLFISVLFSVIILLFGIMGMTILAMSKTPPAKAKNGERPIKVAALRVEQKDVSIVITGYGQVKALNVVSIASEVAGKIVAIHPRLEIGEVISKGDVLFKIDPKDYLTIRKINRERLKILNEVISWPKKSMIERESYLKKTR